MKVRERLVLLTYEAGREHQNPVEYPDRRKHRSELVKPLTAGQTLVDKDIPSTTILRSSEWDRLNANT